MTSRLAGAQSAYLRSAADQPVAWFPWGPEAFERARREDKPILLDVGAVWCHWCHVMDRESYEHAGVAELLNRDWVCIKVDRDERPDVDARYQRAVQAITGQGGWPLTAFLTPDGEVFYGGTYFPPDTRHGRPGLTQLLTELARLYAADRPKIREQAAAIGKSLEAVEAGARAGPVSSDLLARAADAAAHHFDFRHGGFGTQPKFPHPATCEFLLARWFDTREPWIREVVTRTLAAMANGGIRDHLGGGFHRYSVDARWLVPHFEKMLYDNSELLRLYCHAATALDGPGVTEAFPGERQLYREVIDGIVTWVTEVMSDPDGGYWASQDADVGPDDDGDYFTWTPDEARAATDPDEYEVLSRYYDIDESGEMHHHPQKNVLWIRQPVSQIAAALARSEDDVAQLLRSGCAKLRAARAARPTPYVDATVYTHWSAMMAAALLEASTLLGRPALETHALGTLDRLFREAADQRGVLHGIGSDVPGMLEDHVQLAAASLDAFEATGDARWMHRATELMEHVWADYRSPEGPLLDVPRARGGEGMLNRPVTPVQDSPTPSPNGVAAIVLARLAEHAGDGPWRRRRDQLLEALAGGAVELSIYGSTLHRAIEWATMPVTHVVIVAAGDARDALAGAARAAYRPRKVVTLLPPGADAAALADPVRAMVTGAAPRAYVCTGTHCAPPVETPEALATAIAGFGTPT